MKTMLTLTVVFLSPLAVLAAPPVQAPAQAPVQAPNKAVQAPTQAPTQAPAKTAQADTGYRTYSYMPGGTPTNYNNGGYYRNSREPGFFSGHQSAGYKIKGQFWAR